jgi:hypothetical protein
MSEGQPQPSGPDLAQGLALAELVDGAMLLGHVGDQAVLLARRGQECRRCARRRRHGPVPVMARQLP